MKKTIIMIISIIGFAFWGCEEPTKPDTTPPSITITSFFFDTVFEIVTITVMVADNSGIEKVELWVDGGFIGISDNTEPYTLDWNTTTYEDGSSHIIVVRAYDNNGNTTDSNPLILVVDNSIALPTAVNLSVTFSDGSFILIWSRNNDSDFASYSFYESETNDQTTSILIYHTEIRNDTTYSVTHEGDEERYFWVSIKDTLGLTNLSDIASGYPIISLPTEFPLEGGTAWVYERYSYENESDYLQELNAEISYDTLYIEAFENDNYLYYWDYDLSWGIFPIVKNFDNKLLHIGQVDTSDIVYFEKPVVWFVYDESFDTSLIKQDYELGNLIERHTIIDTLYNQPYYK